MAEEPPYNAEAIIGAEELIKNEDVFKVITPTEVFVANGKSTESIRGWGPDLAPGIVSAVHMGVNASMQIFQNKIFGGQEIDIKTLDLSKKAIQGVAALEVLSGLIGTEALQEGSPTKELYENMMSVIAQQFQSKLAAYTNLYVPLGPVINKVAVRLAEDGIQKKFKDSGFTVPVPVDEEAPLEDVEAVEDEPAEADITEAEPTEAEPTEAEPTEVKPTEVKPTEVKPTEVKPTEEKSTEPQVEALPEVQTSQLEPTKTNGISAEASAPTVEPKEDKPLVSTTLVAEEPVFSASLFDFLIPVMKIPTQAALGDKLMRWSVPLSTEAPVLDTSGELIPVTAEETVTAPAAEVEPTTKEAPVVEPTPTVAAETVASKEPLVAPTPEFSNLWWLIPIIGATNPFEKSEVTQAKVSLPADATLEPVSSAPSVPVPEPEPVVAAAAAAAAAPAEDSVPAREEAPTAEPHAGSTPSRAEIHAQMVEFLKQMSPEGLNLVQSAGIRATLADAAYEALTSDLTAEKRELLETTGFLQMWQGYVQMYARQGLNAEEYIKEEFAEWEKSVIPESKGTETVSDVKEPAAVISL